MKKQPARMHAMISALGFAFAAGIAQAANGTWNATSSGDGIGNWQEAGDNWGMGSGVYPGSADTADNASITGGTVTLDGDLPFAIGKIDMSGTSVLNLGANVVSSSSLYQLLNGPSVTVNQSAGTFSRTGAGAQNIFLGTSGGSDSTHSNTWNISGTGALDLTGSNFTSFNLGYAANTVEHLGTSTVNISEQGALRLGRAFRMVKEHSYLNIDASGGAIFQQTAGSLTNDGIFMSSNTATPTVAYHSTISVSGYHPDTVLELNGTFRAYQNSLGLGNTAKLQFLLGNSPMGVNAWDVNVLDLGNDVAGQVKAALDVDVTALPGVHTITLFDYTTLNNGAFGDVTVFGSGVGQLSQGTFDSLGENQYALHYGDGTSDVIRLQYNFVVPEPGTFCLLLLGGLGALTGLRRRPNV